MEYPMKNFLKVLPVIVVLLLISNPALAEEAPDGELQGQGGGGARPAHARRGRCAPHATERVFCRAA